MINSKQKFVTAIMQICNSNTTFIFTFLAKSEIILKPIFLAIFMMPSVETVLNMYRTLLAKSTTTAPYN